MPRFQSQRLPVELLIAIADQLWSHEDIISFGLTCKSLYALLVKKQRRVIEVYFDAWSTAYTAARAEKYRLLNQQAAVLIFPCAEYGFCFESPHGLGPYDLRMSKIGANQLFGQHGCELAKGIRELTLSGFLPYTGVPNYTMDGHPLIESSGFRAIRPETLRIDLNRQDWDINILQAMSVTNLKVLKLPICLPSDCVRLGHALTTMPRLVNLTITDIPDRQEFLVELEEIGKGIMSCAPNLRELDLEMTNFNRQPSWSGVERFVEPEVNGFFFHKLFPCPPEAELLALYERHRRNDTNPMIEAPIHLTKLRLKHMSLPWYSFGIIFDATTIKGIHLPFSMVDKSLWRVLEVHAQLDALTEISYDMLSTGFLGFLGQQSSLKELTFARPQNRYHATDVISYGDSSDMVYGVSGEAPRLGPDAGAGYPSLEDFVFSLENMTMLKHLVLPVDMYTITCSSLLTIAASLPRLEHLEIGFDYGNLELQRVFSTYFLCGTSSLKKITFLSLRQPRPLPDFDSARFHVFITALGSEVSTNLKLIRYMPPNQVLVHPPGKIKVYYHQDTPVNGEWWMYLPSEEGEQVFTEGRTPRVVPTGKWDWETDA